MATRARYPQLMELGDPPRIIGHRCSACGRTAFPPDPYGCEQCGASADELAPTSLDSTGRIHAVATVHRHHRPQPETPFTVATIVLDSGPTLKGVLHGDVRDANIGARVHGVAVPWDVDDDGTDVVDLRFQLDGGGR